MNLNLTKLGGVIFCSVVFNTAFYSQSQTNALPSTGKVGVGTSTPACELDVKGATAIDGTLLVKDSVRLEKKLIVDQDTRIKGKTVVDGVLRTKSNLKVEGNARVEGNNRVIGNQVVDGNLKAKSNLNVLGNTKTVGNEVVEGNSKILGVTKMKGNAFVEGDFKFKGLADPSMTDQRILTILPNGKTEVIEKSGLALEMAEIINDLPCLQFSTPHWVGTAAVGNTVAKIHTGTNCTRYVGINNDNPTVALDVTGGSNILGNVKIGVVPSIIPDAKLEVVSTNGKPGIWLHHNGITPYHYGIVTQTDNASAKAFAVNNPVFGDTYHVRGDGSVYIFKEIPADRAFVIESKFHADPNDKEVFKVYGTGVVYATELFVKKRQDFPDYVFKETYELMPLDELETYIDVNGKLPNMPSAEEVAEKGFAVGELEVTLVEKVEELTLHLIALQKKYDALEAQLKDK